MSLHTGSARPDGSHRGPLEPADEGRSSTRLRLLHFDIKTYRNYGDTLLFECVRHVLNGAGNGNAFEVAETWPLRHRAGPSLIDRINDEFDAIVVGGGGLFLRDTNENPRSGWQWDISIEQLRRLRRPVIMYAVGYNRFYGQPDFDAIFDHHLAQVACQSAFFGLRNHGSISAIRRHLPEELRSVVEYQPCPTVHLSTLFPAVISNCAPREDRVLGVQFSLGERERLAGFDVRDLSNKVQNALRRLCSEGWEIHAVSHVPADSSFADHLVECGLASRRVALPYPDDPLSGGIEYYGSLPLMLGNRGHTQMIPFGLGNIPISIVTHPKLAFFAADIARPEWAVDPHLDNFEENLYGAVVDAHDRRTEHRAHIADEQDRLWNVTRSNLERIYRDLSGCALPEGFAPYSPRELRLATTNYVDSRARWRSAIRVQQLERELASAHVELDSATRALRADVRAASQLQGFRGDIVRLASYFRSLLGRLRAGS